MGVSFQAFRQSVGFAPSTAQHSTASYIITKQGHASKKTFDNFEAVAGTIKIIEHMTIVVLCAH